MTAHLASIHRYPVKSMLGEDLAVATVGERGLLGDRGYALVDAEDGIVASAKHPRKWAGLLAMSARYLAEPSAEPDADQLPPVEITLADGRRVRSDDPDADAVLSAETGRSLRLLRDTAEQGRFEEVWPQLEGLAPQGFIEGTQTGTDSDGQAISTIPLGALAPPKTFFDVATLHVLTTATLAHLAQLNPAADFDARRYRPNLVIDADRVGFAEDDWTGLSLGIGDDVRMRVAMPTMRCVMTTLAQRDLPADADTLRTIAKHHRLKIAGMGTWACAGAYATVAAGGTIRLGDRVGPSGG